jgi:hypothetical protein
MLLDMALEGAFHRFDGDVFAPAGRHHRLEHRIGAVAGLGLLDDPLPQLRRDLLCLCRAHAWFAEFRAANYAFQRRHAPPKSH